MRQKCVFFDIDGTIYNFADGVTPSAREAIRKLRENGHLAFLCTGRSPAHIPRDVLEIGFDGVIGLGGAYIEYRGEEIVSRLIPDEEAKAIVRHFYEEMGMYPILEGPVYVYADREELKEERVLTYELYADILGDRMRPFRSEHYEAAKITICYRNRGYHPEDFACLAEKYEVHPNRYGAVEITPKNCSKAGAIETLLTYLGKTREDTYAFGDDNNDLEMLGYTRFGVAMGNANPEVRETARYHTASVTEDGVADALKNFKLI
ncbi:MAG: Cof-type HAD-IIB family hydrolase [Lachnospiraceae bacterium]|nr:Cof-type HAD-IIB family hydrolase [Lachnospiraceae bacterium]